MTEYNWTIAQLERQTDTGGVVTVHWRCSAVDGDYSASAYSSAGFTPDPTDPSFTPYDQVVEAEVLAWCWVLGGVDKDEIEAKLSAQIEEQKTPKIVTGLPW